MIISNPTTQGNENEVTAGGFEIGISKLKMGIDVFKLSCRE
jgi:hypothetical protein